MAHCSCDPKLEVSPGPLSFSPFFGSGFYVSPCLQFDRLLSKASPSGAYCLGPVAAWAAECSDTAWIYSLIIRQMGWSRCGPCGDFWSCMRGRTGSRSEPLTAPPHCYKHRGGWMQLGEWGTPSFHSLPPFSSPFLLLRAIPTGERGPLLSQNTHTQNLKDTS